MALEAWRIDGVQDLIGAVQPVARLASDLPQQAKLNEFLYITLRQFIGYL